MLIKYFNYLIIKKRISWLLMFEIQNMPRFDFRFNLNCVPMLT